MKNKNKGFTLIEIIICIALITALGTVSVIITNKSAKSNKNVYKKADAALEIYLSNNSEVLENLETHNGAYITLEVLKNEGLLENNLKVDYKNDYYFISDAVLVENDESTDEELNALCQERISINIIKSWEEKNSKRDTVIYVCPKKQEEIIIDKETIVKEYIEVVKDNNDKNKDEICDVSEIENDKIKSDSLACQIINNAKNINEHDLNNGYAKFYEPNNLPSNIGYETTANESVLSYTEDDYGTSYYYRGVVENNYVSYNNMCWRIVRIDGNGNLVLILQDYEEACNYKKYLGHNFIDTYNKRMFIGQNSIGYDYSTIMPSRNYYYYPDYTNGSQLTGTLTNWINDNFSNQEKLVEEELCVDTYDLDIKSTKCVLTYAGGACSTYGYGGEGANSSSSKRLTNNNFSYKCSVSNSEESGVKTSNKYKSRLLTLDEAVFAGYNRGVYPFNGSFSYLSKFKGNNFNLSGYQYQYLDWLLGNIAGNSSNSYFNVYSVKFNGAESKGYIGTYYNVGINYGDANLRPVIVLDGNQVEFESNDNYIPDGSLLNPYQISL